MRLVLSSEEAAVYELKIKERLIKILSSPPEKRRDFFVRYKKRFNINLTSSHYKLYGWSTDKVVFYTAEIVIYGDKPDESRLETRLFINYKGEYVDHLIPTKIIDAYIIQTKEELDDYVSLLDNLIIKLI